MAGGDFKARLDSEVHKSNHKVMESQCKQWGEEAAFRMQ